MRRLCIALLVLFVALAGVIGWQAVRPSDEPVYKGKTLTSWLKGSDDYFSLGPVGGHNAEPLIFSPLLTHAPWTSAWVSQLNPPSQEAAGAVRQIGTNAIPTLLRLLRTKDSPLKVKAMALLERQHFIHPRFTPPEYWHYAAAWAFSELRENARSAVPGLLEIAKQDISPSSRKFAIVSLGLIGPPAKEAVSPLRLWATNADQDVRVWASSSLDRIEHGTPSFPIPNSPTQLP